jgi:hypothetical protein
MHELRWHPAPCVTVHNSDRVYVGGRQVNAVVPTRALSERRPKKTGGRE